MQVNSISSTTTINAARKASTSVKGDGSFQSYLGETKELDVIFQKAAKTYGVDVNLLKSVARVESNFHANAVSGAGAVGIMQLMPNTAKGLGVKNSYDPEQNIMGGAKLISQLMKKYDGDLELTLAGYNAGTGNVQKYGGVPPWQSVHKYIDKVLGYYKESGGDMTTTKGQSEQTTEAAPVYEFSESFIKANNTNTADKLTAMLDTLNLVTTESKAGIQDVFSYDKYLQFINLYLKEKEDE